MAIRRDHRRPDTKDDGNAIGLSAAIMVLAFLLAAVAAQSPFL
ncbi:MAG: hypothetical protein WD904_11650 [Dehalococcoidia bacterium]